MVQAHLQPASVQSSASRRAMLAAGISMLVAAPYQLAKGESCHAMCCLWHLRAAEHACRAGAGATSPCVCTSPPSCTTFFCALPPTACVRACTLCFQVPGLAWPGMAWPGLVWCGVSTAAICARACV